MGRTSDKDPAKPGDAPTDPRPGRVEVDARGRNVWRWNRQEGDSTSVLLQRLDNQDLALEPTRKVPVVKTAAAPARPASSAGAAPARPVTKPAVAARAPAKPPSSGAKPVAGQGPKKPASNPFARERDSGDKGGGFDPYNSR